MRIRLGVVAALGLCAAFTLVVLPQLLLVDPLDRVGAHVAMERQRQLFAHKAARARKPWRPGAGRAALQRPAALATSAVPVEPSATMSSSPPPSQVALSPQSAAASQAALRAEPIAASPAADPAAPNPRAEEVSRWRVAVAAVVRADGDALLEWVEYHRLLGVGHFFLMSNDCTDSGDDSLRDLRPHIEAGVVEVGWEYWCTPRSRVDEDEARSRLGRWAANSSAWLAFLAADEFLVVREHSQLVGDVLDAFPGFDAVAAPVRVFGSSGFRSRPNGSVVANYVLHASPRAPLVRALATPVVRPTECLRIAKGQCGRFRCQADAATADGAVPRPRPHCGCTVSADKRRCVNDAASSAVPAAEPSASPLWVNKYLTKSEAEWKRRQERGLVPSRWLELASSQALSEQPDYHAVQSVRLRLQRLKAARAAASAPGDAGAEDAARAEDFLRQLLLSRDVHAPQDGSARRATSAAASSSAGAASAGGAASTFYGDDLVRDHTGKLRKATWREKVRRAQHEHLNAARKHETK